MDRHLDQIRTLVLQTRHTIVLKVALRSPIDQVLAGKDSNFEIDRVRYDHNPALRRFIPNNFRITKLRGIRTAGYNNRVSFVLCERVATIMRIRNVLCLVLWDVDGVNCHHTVGLVGEEARGVVHVDDGGAGEHAFGGAARKDGNGLVGPGIPVFACGMAPMLVASYIGGWIICKICQREDAWKESLTLIYIGSRDGILLYHRQTFHWDRS
jgi:hypothetical protein